MSSLFLDAFGVDKEDSENGRWVKLLERDGVKVEVLIRRTTCKKYKDTLATLMEPYREALSLGILEGEVYAEILKNAVAKSIVRDWKGIRYNDEIDDEVPYTEENAVRLFNDFPDFFDLVLSAAGSKENFIIQDIEKAKSLLKKN